MEDSILNPETLEKISVAVTQYLIPTAIAIFAAVFQIISSFRTNLGKDASRKVAAKTESNAKSESDELVTILKMQYQRQRKSQKFMLFLIVVITIGISYLFHSASNKEAVITTVLSQFDEETNTLETNLTNIKEINEVMGIVSMETLDKDEKTFNVDFDKSCSNEYVCMVDKQNTINQIRRYISVNSRERNMQPVIYLSGFATQDASMIYNSRTSMRRAILVYQELIKYEKYIIGGINIAELSDISDEKGNSTSVKVSIAWHEKPGPSDTPENQPVSEAPVELAESEAEEQNENDEVADSHTEAATSEVNQGSNQIATNAETRSASNTIASGNTVAIEEIYTTNRINSTGEDIKSRQFINGQRVYVRFKARVNKFQKVLIIWKSATGEEIRKRTLSLKYSNVPYRMHDYKSVFASRGKYAVEIQSTDGKVLGKTAFVVK